MQERRVPELLADEPYDEESAPYMFRRYGVQSETGEKIVEALDPVTKFAHRGAAIDAVRRGE